MLKRLKELKNITDKKDMPSDQAFKDAETFIEYLKDIDVIEPRITIAKDKEINFCWHDIGIYIDLGFYGDKTYSYFAKNKSGRKYYGDNLSIERGIQRRILNIIKK